MHQKKKGRSKVASKERVASESKEKSKKKAVGGLLMALGVLSLKTPLLAVALVGSGAWLWSRE